ncbi:DUF1329 domain-containing protein [Aestuariirhabdus sp. Z084]|uniref:DUF1329 domain-containing protein n=1 Tax=Aestuariirhabdus haliotis TaxID=2918751 RepID=UPI00201B3B83|nr:DUF1329 domain-containing protein [Aestuariirhabdus haliotis]MCL6414611.1 DUF1329 domain-containing protein [Aestuariirhabdus haliotis]MCL6418407.1 DUF1329 domain-containing protein [Aestuariirhabdus haliotis]
MLKKKLLVSAIAALSMMAGSAMAAVSADEAAKLGNELTPLGGEKAGNAAGTIPAWDGGITEDKIPSAFKHPGQHYPNPYAGEKPEFVITAENVDQYADNLTPGQLAMFKAYPQTFKMPIYKTHRSHSSPQRVYDATKAAATKAQLSDGGNGVTGAVGATPFPIPQNGLEALWNHVVRYRGEYVVRSASEVAVQRNGNYTLVSSQQEAGFKYYYPDMTDETLENILFYYLSFTKAPARLAGGAVLVHETLDQVKQPRQSWAYNAGQRRVRRAPSISYDTPITDADGLRTADDTDMYNGAPDRYNWKLVGKKEIYIPYNNYNLISSDVKYDQLLQANHVNPEYTRYELHRVWEVEGTLKEGARHIYSKRTLFLDEDSWGAAVVDQYDGRGDLWRVSMAYLINFYDLPTTWTGLDVFHDLQARRYHAQGLANEEPAFVDFSQQIPKARYFKSSSLRRRGTR